MHITPEDQDLALRPNLSIVPIGDNHTDPFDSNAEPIMYMSENRTPAITDLGLVVLAVVGATCLLLLLILLPSIRRNKWRNFVCLSLMIFLGVFIPLSTMKPDWMLGETELDGVPYDSLHKNQFTGQIVVEIGLNSMNVSLIGRVTTFEFHATTDEKIEDQINKQEEPIKLVNFNERFQFAKPDQMQLEHQEAMAKGLPYPILSVTEYFSHDSDGFNWTRHIRQAGYYTSFLLYVTFACWLASLFLMCALPAYFMTVLRATCLLYAASYLNYLICVTLISPSAIIIYSNKLLIGPGYSVWLSIACFVAAYYYAQHVETLFELQQRQQDSTNQSLTIMDSEDYLNDKKTLSHLSIPSLSLSLQSKEPKNGPQASTVIIPIHDITTAERFRF